ncbi:molybdenum cofactor guanylyltransferase [Aurantiacibacter atlanticus]|uniref:Molybdenum cofactor guanylyltransferase n=1 Tax=Aurantiacibacter atlanticus TaxID=1648404 RepID=A0A0H4VEZ4_9SPHN|nr:molybdenum cofactor guanylyltransferase [Aurantiacibacter atlanticus]AKQ41669.1 molybdenum cofactor guanylyltransferase [Aurantiacibacter atlanticus]
MILGVVLAGGQSTRFGSDKALAEIGGFSLIQLAVDALASWCDTVLVAGRQCAPVATIPDWPRAGCGPLGGIAAGLRYARDEGFASMLTCGVDSADLPDDLVRQLSPAPACFASQPVIGHWPVAACEDVERILNGRGRHSMRAFAHAIGAREVISSHKPANINTQADLAEMEKRHGL